MHTKPISTANPVQHSNRQMTAIVSLIIGAIGIGFAPIFVRLSHLGPLATGFWRVGLALPLLWLLNLVPIGKRDCTLPARNLRDYGWVALSGVFFAGVMGTWNLALSYTTVANATMLANCSPVLVALWGWLVLRRPISFRFIVGLVFAIQGMVLLVSPHLGMSAEELHGDLLSLTSAGFLAGYVLTINHCRQKFTTMNLMTWSSLASALVLLIFGLIFGESFAIPSLHQWLILLSLALFAQTIGQGLIAYALAYLPVTFSSTGLIIQPLIAAIAAWVLFGEALSGLRMIGILIALVGIYMVKRAG